MKNELVKERIVELDKATVRKGILDFEQKLGALPISVKGKELDKLCPLKHTFADGLYIREIFMPKGVTLTSKIHKIKHPYFIIKGKCSVLTDEGVVELEAPYHGITEPGTKRVLYIHEDCTWITVHSNPDNTEDLKVIESRIIAKTFDEIPYKTKQIKEAQ